MVKIMLSFLEKWEPHKKWLASVAIFLSTALVPNDLGTIAMFCDVPPLGFYAAEMITEEDFTFLRNNPLSKK